MCRPAKEWLGVLREYKPEIVMILGFVAAGIMYHDMRAYIDAQTRTLTEINLRIANLELVHNSAKKYHNFLEQKEANN